MSFYFMFWDQLENEGVLHEFETPEGKMIDNEKILELTRAQLKLINPNMMHNKSHTWNYLSIQFLFTL